MAENVVSWTLDGEEVALDLHAVTGHEWRAARLVTGLRHLEIIHAAIALKDMEAIAVLVWIAKRRTSPSLTYEQILAACSIDALSTGDG